MKDIIFKTLMLKGEAGSTIVSMEKTGHAGTTDTYTITFDNGSTTDIYIENLSSVDSVQLTSQTDTEDTYTVTLSDGSTQSFSVKNHNADIEAMSEELAAGLASIAADMAEQAALLSARMDTFTALEDGSTTGDAELADLRVGDDGETYGSAGSAVRSQFSDIKSDLFYNFADASIWEQGAISSSTGSRTTSATRIRTADYINKIIDIVNVNDGYRFMLFAFTNNDEYVGTWNGTSFAKETNWRTKSVNIKTLPKYKYKIVFATTADANILPADGVNCYFFGHVDDTFELDGIAANAKSVGDKFVKTDAAIYEDIIINGSDISWTQGTIGTTGIVGDSNYMIRSGYVNLPCISAIYQGVTENTNHVGYVAYVCQYTANKTFISRDQILTATGEITSLLLDDNCIYARFLLGHATATGETIDPSEGQGFEVKAVAIKAAMLSAEFEDFRQATVAVNNKVDLPSGDNSRYGESGQVLSTLADGRTKWINMALPSPETITEIVSDWLDENPQAVTNESNRAYANMSELIADSNISSGMICRTLGFYSSGDDGGAYYKILNTGTANGMDIVELSNGLMAHLIRNQIINVKQLGAYGDATHDDSSALLRSIELLDDGDTLYFPKGIYLHGDGVADSSGTGNSYTPTGTGNAYYHDAEHPVDIGRDIRLIISNLNNINIIGCGKGSTILSNPENGECRNNEIFSIINCSHVSIKNIAIDGNRQNRGLYLTDSDYGGYNQRGNLRIIGCENVIIDNLTSINSGMDGLYLGVSNIDSVKRKSQNCYILNSDFSNAHRNGISIAGCSFVYVGRNITDGAGVSGETWGGTNPKACVDIEADYGEDYPNDQIFIDGMKAMNNEGSYAMYISSHSHNIYVDHCTVNKTVYTSSTDTSNINTNLISIE